MPIKLLPEEVASRIAAGEVVERPASVVKELVENSLDAGATRVEVETRDGGVDLIRVRDNGSGIASDEVALAFRRHATSKLETAIDLETIATLGFRGEALSSVAAVSRTTCITRHGDEAAGTRLRLEGGIVVHQATTGRPPGTELIVEDLFYNVPARRKFLRTERTERRHIDAFMTRYAIAYPDVAFSVTHNGREVLATPGHGNAQEVLIDVYGMELGASLIEILPSRTEGQTIRVRGFVGPTNIHRANRGYITLFINGRWIEDLRLTYAIIQAYHTLLPVKRYPVAFVLIEMPAEEVDVNVHPTKSEVRFRDSDAVFRAVQRAVRSTVVGEAPTSVAWSPEERGSPAPSDQQIQRARLAALRPAQGTLRFTSGKTEVESYQSFDQGDDTPAQPQQHPGEDGASGEAPSASAPIGGDARPGARTPDDQRSGGSRQALPPLRMIGQVATMFIVAEGPEGVYLIDQHAAHERVLYERMVLEQTRGDVPRQPLLEPEVVTLPVDEADQLETMAPALNHLGMEVEPFGPNTFLVRTMPAPLKHLKPADLLADIAATAGERSPVEEELEEMVIRQICKRAAVKAGQVLAPEEMDRLIRDLERTQNPRTCPHGRPTVIQISTEELIKYFGRTG